MWLVQSNHEQGMNPPGSEGHISVTSWEKSRKRRDVTYLRIRAARPLSRFVCLLVGSGQLRCKVHERVVRKKSVGAFLSWSGSLLRLLAKETEAPPESGEGGHGSMLRLVGRFGWQAMHEDVAPGCCRLRRTCLDLPACCHAPGLVWASHNLNPFAGGQERPQYNLEE